MKKIFILAGILTLTLFTVIARENITSYSSSELKVGTYNLQNFQLTEEKTTAWKKFFSTLEFDLLAIQEVNDTHSVNKLIKMTHPSYESKISYHGGSGEQKLGFIFNTKKLRLLDFKEVEGKKGFKNLRPFVMARFQDIASSNIFPVVTVHLKAGSRPEHREKRQLQLEHLNSLLVGDYENSIILGDFNSTNWSEIGSHTKNWSQKRNYHGTSQDTKCSTFYRTGKIYRPSLLDHLFAPKKYTIGETIALGACQKFQCMITTKNQLQGSLYDLSDHCPVLTKLKW